MKQIFTNWLRAFTLAVSFLFAISLSAVEVEIDGINYELITKIKEATVIRKSSGKYSGRIVIPESVEYEGVTCHVTSIGDDAFYYCNYLTSVTIPNSVESIGNSAFEYCSRLTEVHISDIAAWCKIEFGDYYANPLYNARRLFLDSEEIKDLVIPDDVTSIGYTAFYYCSGLTSITIPNSVTSIGKYAFDGCSGLTSVVLNCKRVEGWFTNISGIKTITIGNSVESIGDYAFYGCSGLTSVMVEDGNEVYDSRDNCNAIIETATNTLIVGSNSSVIPNSVTSIDSYAFSGCSGLTSVTIPNSVTSIGESSFSGCSGLTSVTIPNSVTSIEWSAFAGCSELTDVYCYAEEVPSTESNAFANSYVEYAILHVPDASIEGYKATTPWSGFGRIVALTEEEMAAGVEDVVVEDVNSNDAPVYNLQGMKMQNVDNLPKGIYIKGGKKFMVK